MATLASTDWSRSGFGFAFRPQPMPGGPRALPRCWGTDAPGVLG